VSPKSPVCVELKQDLVAVATEEAGTATTRRVQAHVERCRPCRDEFDRYRRIEGEVAAMRGHLLAAPHVALSRDRLEARLADLRSRLVAYRVFPSPVGPILIARSEQGVLLIEYLGRQQRVESTRLGRLLGAEAVEDDGETEGLYRELSEYLEGRRTRFEWPLDLRLVRSQFHRDVLRATAEIPYGAVVSYAGLAREVGRPQAVRAAAQALRWNPVPIVVPCHRVIGSSGALTGYAGGTTERKQQLLALEGIPMVKAGHDFRIRRDAMYVLAPGDSEYCLPSCPSVDPFPRGGVLFGSRQRAESVGLAPCTSCRPDLHPLPVASLA
jgi:methylated-DNA-[protein]-cysteine S-methyltransferase